MKLSSFASLCLTLSISSNSGAAFILSGANQHATITALPASTTRQITEGGFLVNAADNDEYWAPTLPSRDGATATKQAPKHRPNWLVKSSNADAHVIAKKAAQERRQRQKWDAKMAQHVKSRVSVKRQQYGPSWLVPSLPKAFDDGPVEWATPDAKQAKEVKRRVSSVRQRHAVAAATVPKKISIQQVEKASTLGNDIHRIANVQDRVSLLREKYRMKQQARKSHVNVDNLRP